MKYLLFISFFSLQFFFNANALDPVEKDKEIQKKINKILSLQQEINVILNELLNLLQNENVDPKEFQNALLLIKNGNYDDAKKILVNFTKGKGPLALQALYWIGVCFIQQQNYEKALPVFTHFINRMQEASSLPEIKQMELLANKYLAQCFEKLGRVQDACAVLKNIETDVPGEIEFVQKKMLALDCSKFSSSH